MSLKKHNFLTKFRLSIFFLLTLVFILSQNIYSQNCGIKNPSFENFTACPTGFSDYNVLENWVNILPDLVSEPDYLNESCPNGLYGNFNYNGYSDVDITVTNYNAQHLCGRVGLYLNKHKGDDPRLKEYITQRVNLTSGVTYQIKIQVEKSSFTNSSNLQRDLTFFGYNGSIPTTNVNFCPTGVDSLTAIPRSSITTSNSNFIVNFTPTKNYDYLVIGANCNSILNATKTGYVFIDRVELTSTSNSSSFTPIINSISNDSNYSPLSNYGTSNSSTCKNCFSDYRNKMVFIGNTIPPGITAIWGQKSTNPETVIFSTPSKNITSLTGTTKLIPGSYIFYYTFTNGTCTLIDSLEILVKPPLSVTAGSDILNCGGNNDTYNNFPDIRYKSTLSSPDIHVNSTNHVVLKGASVTGGNYKSYWSMIQSDGSEHIFPHNYNGILPQDSGVCQDRVVGSGYNLTPSFSFKNSQDSIYFILHVLDQCNTLSEDTMLYVFKDINLRFDRPTYCLGDEALIHQLYSSYNTSCFGNDYQLKPAPNLTFTWNIDDPGLTTTNSNVTDSLKLQITQATRKGWHTIRLTVFDSLTNCTFFDEHKFYVKDSLTHISAGKDYVFCGGNNDNYYDTSISNSTANTKTTRDVVMNAIPVIDTINANSYSTWWSMIRNDGSEWTFTNPCGIPYNGSDEGDVVTYNSTTSSFYCGNIPASSQNLSHSPNAKFHFRNARDTVKFIFHLQDICKTDTLEYADTMVVYMNDIDLPTYTKNYCINDTGMISQINSTEYRKTVGDSNLIYSWTAPPDVILIDSTVKDSLFFYFDTSATRGNKIIRVTITDTSSGCSWYDETKINIRKELDSVNAGPDIILCNNNFRNQKVAMNAYPKQSDINKNNYYSYWSAIQPSGPDYVFYNPYGYPFIGSGTDEGLIYTTSYKSFNPNSEFIFKVYGEKTLVWHVIDYCDTSIHLTDTIQIKWDFNEPNVSAGPDQNPKCDAAFLTGNPSASSSGTSGCFKWRQISGIDTLDLLDSLKRVAQVINLDSATPGVYQFEYTIGCLFCPKKDTMTLTISNIKKPPFALVWDTISKICIRDSLTFTGLGGSEYQWYVNDSLVQKYSSDNIFSIANSLDTIKVSVLIKDSINECISYNQNLFHKFVGVICYADRDTIYTCGDACVSTGDLPYGNHVFKSCDSLTTKIGATFTLTDTCITYNHLNAPKTWLYDTLCVELKDTINDIYDTTDIFIINCDSSLFLSCKDTTLYLNNLGQWINIDTSFVVDSVYASTGIDSIILSKDSFDCSNVGTNTVTIIAYNKYYSKSQSCFSTVTILDTIKPIVYCHDSLLFLNSQGVVYFDTSAVLNAIDENCFIDSVWMDKDSAICNQDSVFVTIYARDQSGNIGECSSYIKTKDTLKPIVFCHDTLLYLNSNGKVFFDTSAVLYTIDENCTIDSVWMNKDSASCTNDTVYTTIFARDNSNNIGSCEAIIIIIDTIKPIVFCHDTTLFINSSGKIFLDTNSIYSAIDENCTVDSIWIDKDSADCFQDSILVTLFAKDRSNNIGKCSSLVFIKDTIKPFAICKNDTVYIQNSGWAIIDSSNINNRSSDNCNIVSIKIDKDTFDCTNLGNNTVTLTVTDKSGNQDSCSSLVTILDTNTYIAYAGNDTSYCETNTITMNANYVYGKIEGTWSLDPTFSNANTPTITSVHQHNTSISNLIEGEYQFIWNVSNSNCFDLYDTVLIKIYDQPIAKLPADIDLCYKNSILVQANPLTGLAQGYWTNIYNSTNTPTHTYYKDSARIGNIQQGGEYKFYFEAKNGICPTSKDSITIKRHYIPSANFIVDTTLVCENGCINFTSTSSINPPDIITDYSWTIDTTFENSSAFSLCFKKTGLKDASLIVTSNHGCKDTIVKPNFIRVHPNPVAGFTFKEDKNIKTFIHFFDKSISAKYYEYIFGDGTNSNLKEPSHNYENIGNYTIHQIVTDTVGCKDTILKTIKVRELYIYVPNTFTPNNDGINDVFLPYILGGDPSQYELLIFNRWGEEIFNSDSKTNGWDGFYKGVLSQQGTYIWKLKVKKLDSSLVKEYQGHVILLR